jgi:hypothetical protein
MADPFAQTPQAPAAPGAGFLGIPASTWQNLQNFGANMSVAANARDPNGFLTYGGGIAGPLGEATIQTQQQVAQKNAQLAQQGYIQSQTQGQQLSNVMTELNIPRAEALAQYYSSPQFAQDMGFGNQGQQMSEQEPGARAAVPSSGMPTYNGQEPASASGLTPGAPGSEGTNIIGASVRQVESGGNYGVGANKGGYVGAYQFGSANMRQTGLYKPAPGEDVTKNTWQGQITLPGWQPMSVAQFGASKAAQDAAWNIQQGNYWNQDQKANLDSAIGMNVGGVQITQAGLIAGTHFAGVKGVTNFILSQGKINPVDANGTHLSDYINNVNQQIIQQQQAGFDPSRQVNSQDVPGPFIPQGGVTPAKAQQMVGELSQQLKRMAMAGLPTAGLQAQIDMYSKMATAPYANVDLRQGGLGVIGGNVLKASTPAPLVTASGASVPGAEYGGYSVNGQEASPAQVAVAQQPGAAGAAGAAQAQQPGQVTIPQFGKPAAAPATPSDMAFDAAVMGQPMPQNVGAGGPMYTKELPGVEETMDEGTKELIKDQDEAQDNAKMAIQGNALLSNMQNESKSWTSDIFATWHNDVRKLFVGVADNLGIPTPNMSEKVGDFNTWFKNSQQFIQQAVHATSSRASTQEYQMIAQSLPNASIGNNALVQITAELKGVNDYKIAYNQAMSNWRKGFSQMSPDQQYIQTLGGFDGAFNQRITPYAFMVHALTETPEGMTQFTSLVHNMQQTPQGRAELGRLQAQWQYAQQAGLFNASGGGTGG